ncbi:MAG TPA: TIGR02757 family protein [Candidatus Ozemobacteraceae bacterium]|nr:TIGR02757 family protein [Candidatus Ozemobacteraceae bacterium]HQG28023.1 TIGR02757 family protein [Candidatus Ozemobacteraceae bacterium]
MTGAPHGAALLKRRLEAILAGHPSIERAALDPVSFPRRFLVSGGSRQEIEIVGLLSAMLAYGKLEVFTRVTEEILRRADQRLLEVACKKRKLRGGWPGYRLSTGNEISRLVHAGGTVIALRGGLFESFLIGWRAKHSLKDGLIALHTDLANAAADDGNGPTTRGLAHLLPDPAKGGAVKRWMMFTRWMVRPDDGVDLGLWPQIPSSALLMPLDRHISRIARNLGFTRRATDDWKTAEEVTAALRRLSPEDPVRYDFALCHLGISGDCTHGRNAEICAACGLRDVCTAGRG